MPKPQTLLEKAKAIHTVKRKSKSIISDEDIELALAWMKGEVAIKQMCIVWGLPIQSGNVLYRIAVILRHAYKNGELKIT